MKNYKEVANSVFERRAQYEIKVRKKRRILTRTVVPICCVCVVALSGLGTWKCGLFEKQSTQAAGDTAVAGTKDWYESEANAHNSGQAQAYGDSLGTLVYKNETYVQTTAVNSEELELDKKIGNGEDFDGYYKTCGIASEVYTIKSRPDLLAVNLENGGYVILERAVN